MFVFAAFFATPSTAADLQISQVTQNFSLPTTASVITPTATVLPAIQQNLPAVGANAAPSASAPALAVPQSLRDLVATFVNYGNQDAEQLCLAKTVYFEARGESLEGQLAVAEVVLNRAASGLYPSTICGVVTQRAQFSFIRRGQFPNVRMNSDCWHKALAIADVARKRLVRQTNPNVLWYHASYVAPAWGKRLTRFTQIGTHIFYS
jgi:spore germination cell wall hydrolase CwlJ-like protein